MSERESARVCTGNARNEDDSRASTVVAQQRQERSRNLDGSKDVNGELLLNGLLAQELERRHEAVAGIVDHGVQLVCVYVRVRARHETKAIMRPHTHGSSGPWTAHDTLRCCCANVSRTLSTALRICSSFVTSTFTGWMSWRTASGAPCTKASPSAVLRTPAKTYRVGVVVWCCGGRVASAVSVCRDTHTRE